MFYLYLVGEGTGCDYTIGCNEKLRCLKAVNLDMAVEESKQILADHGVGECDEDRIAGAVILESRREYVFDLREIRDKAKAERRAEEEKAKTETERETYEKLKRKFEGK